MDAPNPKFLARGLTLRRVFPKLGKLLEPRLLLAFLAFALVIVGAGILYFSHQQAQSRLHAEETLAALADLKVSQIANWFEDRKACALALANNPMITEHFHEYLQSAPGAAPNKAFLTGLAGFLHTRDISAFALYDGVGTLRLVVPADHKTLVPDHPAPGFLAGSAGQVLFKDLEFVASGKDVTLGFWIPVDSVAGGRAKGAILMTLDPHAFLFPLIRKPPLPSATAETLLVRRENDELVYLNELRHRTNTALRLREPIRGKPDLPATNDWGCQRQRLP
jgi:hypothetical protein